MSFQYGFWALLFFLLFPACAHLSPETRILNLYQNNQTGLTLSKRGHWALRLYRISEEPSTLPLLEMHAAYFERRLSEFSAQINNLDFRNTFGKEKLAKASRSLKNKLRNEAFQPFSSFLYDRKLLYYVYKVRDFGREKTPAYETAKAYLAQVSFSDFLLNEKILKYDSAEAVNHVYYLKITGTMDLENELTARFQRLLMAEPDSALGPVEFENKMYGLTHFIIADSDYYQRFVSAKKHAWILNYFAENIENILKRTKPDVIAEVGLCFKLAGQPDHPVVKRTQAYIRGAFDRKTGAIASVKGTFDLNRAEHRNAVAYLLLTDFNRLYVGPKFGENISSNRV